MSNGNTQFDDNFDWATGQDFAPQAGASQEFGGDPTQPANAEDFEFAPIAAVNSAEEIEEAAASREFRPIPLGEHLLVVAGFHGYPKPVYRTGYYRGQSVSWTAYSVGVRLALASDPQATMLDFFDLPPTSPTEVQYYQHASKGTDGKNAGFFAEKFTHFISRLGWPFPKGAPIPIEACKIGNWKGREIIATIEMGKVNKDKIDLTTGQPFPPRPQVKLFSFRPAESTIRGQAGAGGQVHPSMGGGAGVQQRPAQGPGQPQGMPQGMPQGRPSGYPAAQSARPQGNPQGYPQGTSPGGSPVPSAINSRGLANI